VKNRVRNAPISVYITISITIVLIAAIALLSSFAYAESRAHLVQLEDEHRAAAETSLVEYHRLMDRDLAFFDELFSARLRAAFPSFLGEYERAGRNPLRIDLEGLKGGLGSGYDLYVIDDRGVIIATTFRDELGFDLSTYPGFGETLAAMRVGDGFVSDRVVQEKVNGSFRKYAYYPTPDHRFLLEIGLKDQEFLTRSRLYSPPTFEGLRARAPSLRNVTVYNLLKRPLAAQKGTVPRDAGALAGAIETRSTVEAIDSPNATLARYIFIDLLDPVYASDPSLVVEVVYSTRPLEDALSLLGLEHLLIALLAVVLGGLFAVGVATVMTRPVRGLVEDIGRVADGDLDHPLSEAGSAELGVLRLSIDRLTARLREQLAAVRASEQRMREQNEALEQRFDERTRELDEANQEAHLYIDIMLHDLGRALDPALPRAEALAAGLEGEKGDEAVRISEAIRQCTQVLECVAWVDRFRHLDAPLVETELDRAIRDGIARQPDLRVRYDGTDERVMADGFLPEVFVNLLGDSRHYGGSGVNCRVRVELRGDEVLVSIEDDGPGIPDREKDRLFARPTRGVNAAEEPALGLSIAGALVRRYGGRIWADDRIPSGYTRGTVIRFTLPRIQPGTGSSA
jgi:two-component system, NarL family, sensor histidine kinase BarA